MKKVPRRYHNDTKKNDLLQKSRGSLVAVKNPVIENDERRNNFLGGVIFVFEQKPSILGTSISCQLCK